MWVKIEGNMEIIAEYNGMKYYLGPREKYKDIPVEVFSHIKQQQMVEADYVVPTTEEEALAWMNAKEAKKPNDENKGIVIAFPEDVKKIDDKVDYVKRLIEEDKTDAAIELTKQLNESNPKNQRVKDLVEYLEQ